MLSRLLLITNACEFIELAFLIPINCALLTDGHSIDGFWFYQYVALCAISTFYIYIIHRRLDVSALVSEQQNGRPYLDIVDHCQKYLVSLVPKGSSNHKHHLLLAKLRRNAHKIAHRNSNHLPAQENNNLELVDSATTPSLPAVDLELQNHRQEDRSVSNHIVSPDAQAHRPLVGRDGEFCEGSVNRFSNSLVENYLPMAGMNGVDVDHNEVLNHNSNMAVPEFNFDDLNMSWGFIDQCGSYFSHLSFEIYSSWLQIC